MCYHYNLECLPTSPVWSGLLKYAQWPRWEPSCFWKDSEGCKLFATQSLEDCQNLFRFVGKSVVIPKSLILCFPGILTPRLPQCYDSCSYISFHLKLCTEEILPSPTFASLQCLRADTYYWKGTQVHSFMWRWPTEKESIYFAQPLCVSHIGFMLSRHVQTLHTGPLSG